MCKNTGLKIFDVDRRIGGLESEHQIISCRDTVDRRIGGLETFQVSLSKCTLVDRRIGGLDVWYITILTYTCDTCTMKL